jgi:putative transposase
MRVRAYRYRIYPSKKQEALLAQHLLRSKELWNQLLEKTKGRYGAEGKFCSKSELQVMVKRSGLYSQAAQAVAHRLHDAVGRKIKMKKQGVKCGFPRFKSLERMKSLYYPQFGFALAEKLSVTQFGAIAIKQHREVKGRIKTLTLKREASGKWFAILTAEQEAPAPKRNTGARIGIDMGLQNFAALSDGTLIKNPRHLRKYEARLAFVQRRLSRSAKGRNRLRAKLRVARIHERVSNSRMDFLHKLTHQFVNAYSFMALEALDAQRMAEQRFGKSIHDAGWSTFASMLCYKAEEAGSRVVFVDAVNTSKECSNCGAVHAMLLQERTYACPACGMRMDRDLNAAVNILNRATAGTAGSNACSGGAPSARPRDGAVPSMKQDADRFSGR